MLTTALVDAIMYAIADVEIACKVMSTMGKMQAPASVWPRKGYQWAMAVGIARHFQGKFGVPWHNNMIAVIASVLNSFYCPINEC